MGYDVRHYNKAVNTGVMVRKARALLAFIASNS